jgi:hypothetical protein
MITATGLFNLDIIFLDKNNRMDDNARAIVLYKGDYISGERLRFSLYKNNHNQMFFYLFNQELTL